MSKLPSRGFVGLMDPLADRVLRHLATVSDLARATTPGKAARRPVKRKVRHVAKKPPVRRGG